jgi:endoglucanase
MNEPHNIPDMKIWAATVQAAVTAIRTTGATTQMILLPGNDFTGAQTFVSNGSAGNLSTVHNLDGSNTSLIFDVHKYLDQGGSGVLLDCVSDHVNDTFMPLAAFLKKEGRQAILSETGGGNTTSVSSSFNSSLFREFKLTRLSSASQTSAQPSASSTQIPTSTLAIPAGQPVVSQPQTIISP